MRRALSIISAITLATALVGACSSSKSSGEASGKQKVTLTAKNFSFAPMLVSVAKGKVTFVVVNNGTVEHNLTVKGLKIDADVKAGKTAIVTVDAKAGTFPFHCEYHPTKMFGTITITS